ncbi:hypothetical protein CUR178_06557 [Leishmania enriettii]|uniref:Uncharacterized protein n=1 Tax=Leishmania enriettii TaxID=5663 RepID=A0A836H5K5_LEIEN|nr:hypothetical protein CUR178_06557 [Leishmania enriettii]
MAVTASVCLPIEFRDAAAVRQQFPKHGQGHSQIGTEAMLHFTRRLGEHIAMSATVGSPVYTEASHFFWHRRVQNFRRRGPLGKLAALVGYGAAGAGVYVATCLVVRTLHQPTVDALFAPGRDYTLEDWKDVEPTLQPGDIILMRGTGPVSWCITTLQFVLSFLKPAALRYSHVAVVVAPAVLEYVDDEMFEIGMTAATGRAEESREEPSSMASSLSTPAYRVLDLGEVFERSAEAAAPAHGRLVPGTPACSVREQLRAEEAALRRRPVIRRGAVILEAMDNRDYDVVDVKGNVTYDTVQVVEASRRLLSTTPYGVPAYRYFAVRRLRNYEHTPERQRLLARFCEESEGRRMDSSLLYPLAFLSPRLHTQAHPLRQLITGEVSCSELIVELYQELGVVKRRWRWVPLEQGTTAPAPPPSNAVAAQRKAGSAAPHSFSSGDEAGGDTATPPPPPTVADVADDRRSRSLHVYDYVYGRLDARANRPVITRDRPLLPDTSVVENSEAIATADVRLRSSTARLKPSWEHVDRTTSISSLYDRTATAGAEELAHRQKRKRADARYHVDAAVPPLVLRAGDTARGVDGREYQLQWYYKHSSVATCPYHFTEGAGESVLDFAANVTFDRESHMRIVREEDALSRTMRLD